VEQARAGLDRGAGMDEVLDDLRRAGLDKIDSVAVLHRAAGVTLVEAKALVHDSQVWADRRDGDAYVEKVFWRSLFILCVVGSGQVNEPPELAAECRSRQHRATAHMQQIAAGLPPDAVVGYRQHLVAGRFGQAFADLVAAGRQVRVPDGFWPALAVVSDTLCLTELLGEQPPLADDDDYIHAAYLVRQHTAETATDSPDHVGD
jgi:hypothetical protein